MKQQHPKHNPLDELTPSAAEFIRLIIKKMRYRKKVRNEVMAELAYHFEDELKDCKTEEEKKEKAHKLIEEFGDPKLLAILLRRAKKRCRPLWRTVAVRTFQVTSLSMLCFILYAASFLVAKPNLKVDYVKVFNEMARPEISEQDNAWPHYEKAIEAYVKPDEQLLPRHIFNIRYNSSYTSFDDLLETEQAQVRGWVRQNQTALNHFLAASRLPYCFSEYKVGEQSKDKWTQSILMPYLSSLKQLSRVGIWNSRMQRERGENLEAMQTCVEITRTAKHWQLRLTIIEQLVAIDISNLGYKEILRILAYEDFSIEDLLKLQNDLQSIYPEDFPLMNIEPEKFFFRDTVQHFFTDGGIGGGHLIPEHLPLLMSLGRGAFDEETAKLVYLSVSLIHARRNETLEKANQLYDEIIELSRMTPYTKHISGRSAGKIINALPKYRFLLCRTFVPALDNASKSSYLSKSLHEAIISVIALRRWRLEKNAYPDDLTQLVGAGYMEKLPLDPYSDKPLVYRKNSDDFVLYSVGPNFTDDGGKPGRIRMWDGDGDTVFWPVDVLKAE
jgi:hypothetical protein